MFINGLLAGRKFDAMRRLRPEAQPAFSARERIVEMRTGHKRLGLLMVTALLAISLLMWFSGCFGSMSVGEIWKKSLEAEKKITSFHMTTSIYYQNTKFGSGMIQNISLTISGDSSHLQNMLFGQNFGEVIITGGKIYSRAMGNETWTEGPAPSGAQTADQQVGELANLPSLASSEKNVGVEVVNGVEAYHLEFDIPPDKVSAAFPRVPISQLEPNEGATADVWIDKEKSYKVKYQILIKSVLITNEIGNGDVFIVTDVTDINEPIDIAPPI
jgi:hypothetical protein